MNTPKLRGIFGACVALVVAATAFGATPTPLQALEYAKSVVLVQRVVKDNQIHCYVKEVWRFDPDDGTPPAIGAEYREPMSNDPRNKYPERDGIAFTFGKDRPKELPVGWTIPVIESGMVTVFQMRVDEVRAAVKKTNPKG